MGDVMRRATIALVVLWSLWSLPSPVRLAGEQAAPVAVQCSKIWVGQETALEEFLRTGKIARIETVPIGVTKPKRVFFEPGAPVTSAAWKPLRPGMVRGYHESYRAEIAAYELDKLLDLHMVPPYVERRIDGDLGALSVWVENVSAWEISKPVRGSDPNAWNREISRMKLFDRLIGNIDRNQGNLLYDAEFHLILIDHSRAFTTTKDMSKIARISTVDEALWERVKALDESRLRASLSPWLKDNEIKAILTRRDLLEKEIAALVSARGEAIFLR
jgi:hypothetical protein